MNKTLDKRAITTKLMHEAHQLMVIFVYLAVFFFVFKLYTRLLLREYGIGYFVYGLTLLKALVLSKIILTAEMLHVGERFNDRPLSVPTLYKTITFSLFTLVYELLEHIVVGLFRGQGMSTVLAEELVTGWPHLAGIALVVFVSFLPFFAFRETGRVLGESTLKKLFFAPREISYSSS
jgi:hypothetical protein